MATCNKCHELIDKEFEIDSILKCIFCKMRFHPKCVGTTKTLLKSIMPFKGFVGPVMTVLKTAKESVN